jgi:hypothetical protein
MMRLRMLIYEERNAEASPLSPKKYWRIPDFQLVGILAGP